MTRRRASCVTPVVVLTSVAGCGNASQHLSMGPWQEVGEAASPITGEQSSYEVVTLVPGDGPVVVRPGDLVKARLTVTTIDTRGSTQHNPPPQVIWVWTGRDPPPDRGRDAVDYGMVGEAQTRATLIGRQLHEQFQIDLRKGAAPENGVFPVRGLVDYPLSRPVRTGFIDGVQYEPLEWPYVTLSGDTGGRPSARIEILEICPEAKLYRRSARLTQDGLVLNIGDMGYRRHREGTLGWSALDAQCPAPDGHVRFQSGPFYNQEANPQGLLLNWTGSYIALRPPGKHPEEWRAASVKGGAAR